VNAYGAEEFMTAGNLDIKKIDLFVLTMPDNNYWDVGEFVAKAWSVGRELKKAKR
jgi:hypothetical protein